MSWRIQIMGSSSTVEDERDVRDFLRKALSVFMDEGSPSELTNALFEGSHGGNDNLLNNPEAPKKLEPVPAAPAPRPVWNETIPSEVPAPAVPTYEEAKAIHDAGPLTVVHSTADASGTITNEPIPVVPFVEREDSFSLEDHSDLGGDDEQDQ